MGRELRWWAATLRDDEHVGVCKRMLILSAIHLRLICILIVFGWYTIHAHVHTLMLACLLAILMARLILSHSHLMVARRVARGVG